MTKGLGREMPYLQALPPTTAISLSLGLIPHASPERRAGEYYLPDVPEIKTFLERS